MPEPLAATVNADARGGILSIVASRSYTVNSSVSNAIIQAMPWHDGKQWIVPLSLQKSGQTQIVDVRKNGASVAFVSFYWTYEGPRVIHVKNMKIELRLENDNAETNL